MRTVFLPLVYFISGYSHAQNSNTPNHSTVLTDELSLALPKNYLDGFDLFYKKAGSDLQLDTVIKFDTVGNCQMIVYTYNEFGKLVQSNYFNYQNQVWVNNCKIAFTYNSQGEIIQVLEQVWTSNSWKNSSKYSVVFSPINGLPMIRLVQCYENNIWVEHTRECIIYDSYGNIISSTSEQKLNNRWQNISQSTRTYNSLNQLTETLDETFNNKMIEKFRHVYTYKADGSLETDCFENTSNGIVVKRYTCVYNSQGLPAEIVNQKNISGQWLNDTHSAYEYNSAGLLISELIKNWSGSVWANHRLTEYSYDTNGNNLTRLLFYDNGIGWSIDTSDQQLFDENNNLIFYEHHVAGGEGWRVNFQRNSDGTIIEEVHENFENGQWSNYYKASYNHLEHQGAYYYSDGEFFNWENNSWVPACGNLFCEGDFSYIDVAKYQRKYSYRNVNIHTVLNSDFSLNCYPNPASNKLFVSANQVPSILILTDAMGRRIFQNEFYGNGWIDISKYNNGAYLVTVENCYGKASKRVIINH